MKSWAERSRPWEQSLSLREDGTVRAALERVRREAEVEEDYDKQRLAHFIVKYEGETMEQTGRLVLRSLEKSYAFLKSRLDFEPKEPIVVILYARREYNDFGGARLVGWSLRRKGARAGSGIGKPGSECRIDPAARADPMPFCTRRPVRTLLAGCKRAWRNTVKVPMRVNSERMLAERIEEDENFAYCLVGVRCDVRLYYPAATSVVDYIIQNRGMGGIKDLLTLLGQGQDLDAALTQVMGRDELGLMNDWQHFVKRRYL